MDANKRSNIETSELVLQVKQQNKAAFAKLYDSYSAALFGVINAIVKSEEASEDVLQDTFVKIWVNIQKYDEKKGTIFTWMLNIARNTAIDYYRKNKKLVNVEIQNLTSSVSDVSTVVSTQKTDDIGIADKLKNLKAEYQFILKYLYFEGYTHQEISDEFNIPLGTVKTRARTALKKIKKHLISILF